MLTKTWNAEDSRFDVLFDLPSELEIDHAAVVGDFNGWDAEADPMTKGPDGRWSATLSLEPGVAYRFRYHLGQDRWENDWNADDYVGNEFGGSDSVVHVPDAPAKPPATKRATAGRGTAERATTKKGTAKKSAAKKSTTKKSATKKSTTKSSATKKSATNKSATKKSAAKKAAARKTARSAADERSTS